MALNRQATKSPDFEETDLLDQEQESDMQEAATVHTQDKATTAVAAPAAGGVSTVSRPSFGAPTLCVLSQRKNFFVNHLGANVDWRAVVPIKVVTGMIYAGADKSTKLGSFVEFIPLSWEHLWCVAPNTGTVTAETTAATKYSKDGVMLDREDKSCADYIEELKEMYPKAGMSKRGVIHGKLVSADKPSDELKDKLIEVQLSPSSLGAWEAMLQTRNIDLMLKKVVDTEESLVRAECDQASSKKNNNTWSLFKFKIVPMPVAA